MKLLKVSKLLVVVIFFCLFLECSGKQRYSKVELEEFELLNLCHCYEYLELRDLDYIKWQPNGRKDFLDDVGNIKFSRYRAVRLYNQLFQNKYDSSIFLKNGYSKYLGVDSDYTRLDSLYYEPIVKHYINKVRKTENLPYLGFGDISIFFGCY